MLLSTSAGHRLYRVGGCRCFRLRVKRPNPFRSGWQQAGYDGASRRGERETGGWRDQQNGHLKQAGDHVQRVGCRQGRHVEQEIRDDIQHSRQPDHGGQDRDPERRKRKPDSVADWWCWGGNAGDRGVRSLAGTKKQRGV
ncbi:putative spanin [Klebsiella phage vB_KshKPC-M]|nr:putative spanin [Klebsiella phage vB_KshKPC-M]